MGQASEQPARSLDLAEKPTAPLGATTSSKVNDQLSYYFEIKIKRNRNPIKPKRTKLYNRSSTLPFILGDFKILSADITVFQSTCEQVTENALFIWIPKVC